MRARRLMAPFAVAALLSATADSAWADDGVGAFVDSDGDPTATAGEVEPVVAGSSGGSGREDGRRWLVVVENDFAREPSDRGGNPRCSETGRRPALHCPASEDGRGGKELARSGRDRGEPCH